jgi:Sigma-70, region 4
MMLLERLTPLERAVFLLREVFDYEYEDIASIVGQGATTCRQILRRARQHVAEVRRRFTPSPEQREGLVRRFVEASTGGDMRGLLALLAGGRSRPNRPALSAEGRCGRFQTRRPRGRGSEHPAAGPTSAEWRDALPVATPPPELTAAGPADARHAMKDAHACPTARARRREAHGRVSARTISLLLLAHLAAERCSD